MRRAQSAVLALPEADPARRLPAVRWVRPGGRLFGLLGAAILAPTVVVAVAVAAMAGPGVAAATPVSDWSIQSTPNPVGSNFNLLAGVSCLSISQCTSVGGAVNSAGSLVTLAQRWQGSSWTLESTPNPAGSNFDLLSGVSCTSSTACTAVGGADQVTLAELWDGSSWTIQPTPNPPAYVSSLSGVSCTSASACTAVGSWGTTNTFTPVLTLAERRGGTQKTPSCSLKLIRGPAIALEARSL
jgi:hypothetical protein